METPTPLPYGPMLEETRISAGLDYYKPTMSQLQYEKQPDAEVTFTFKNRGDQRIADYVDARSLQARFDQLRNYGWDETEIDFLRSQQDSAGRRLFNDEFLGYLGTHSLPEVSVAYDAETDDIAIQTTGDWPLVTYWETVVMSEVNEAYFEGMIRTNGLDVYEVYDEGDRRLSEKIAMLRANPDIKFSDFGTRRHFSLRWQRHVVERLINECPENLVGTSNVAIARELGLKPIGTFAHEMPMVYAGIADALGKDIRSSHGQFLNDWYERYGNDLSIALTDTFGTDFFFADFTPEQADQFRALRHDSGEPVAFGERVIEFYEKLGIDPKTKTIVFSDGLDIDTILALHAHFKDRINAVFGWGTTLTNDLGVKALNIVMKATEVKVVDEGESKFAKLVKLSDNKGKHTGPKEKVEEYEHVFARTPVRN